MGIVKVGDIGETKLVCIINQSLKMGKGKLAAQVGHASVSASMKLLSKDPEIFELWTVQGQRKVVVKSQSVDEIKEILKKRMALFTLQNYSLFIKKVTPIVWVK
jgi:PTH2 family peptidyl-tRNA hydrolase